MVHGQELPKAVRSDFWSILSVQNCIIMELAKKRGYHTQAEQPGDASTQENSLCWPVQNTAPVSFEFLLVGRTLQDQLNVLNPIRGLQEHQKTLPSHKRCLHKQV